MKAPTPSLLAALLILVFGLGFGWLSVQRHDTYRTNAEDLGFTDQVIWNWLRGQAFRLSMYEEAEFTTDIDLAALTRPDSLLAFHVEPMTALLAPLYLLWPDVRLILLIQAIGWSLGAWPAYRIARRRLVNHWAGLAFASIYLLSPLGQWGVLSDFHTVVLAAPLLLWAADLMESRRPVPFLVTGMLAATAKEEVGLAVAGLGLLACLRPSMRLAGAAAIILGAGWSILCVTTIIPRYAGTAVSPFTARYAELGGSPREMALNLLRAPHLYAETLTRPEVLNYLFTLLLTGGWLAILAPEFLLPALPSLALNSLSSSPWMASGRAHYSAVVLPFVVCAGVVGARRLSRLLCRMGTAHHSRLRGEGGRCPSYIASVVVLLAMGTTLLAYRQSGAGPLADGFAFARRSSHHLAADRLTSRVPSEARVSASSSLLPHLSQRPSIYLFPTVRDADYVALDVSATPFPTSAGDVYLRAFSMLGNQEWRLLEANDGLLLFERGTSLSHPLPERFYDFARVGKGGIYQPEAPAGGVATYMDGALELVSSRLASSGDIGPHGPLGTLETVWRTTRPIEGKPRPRVAVQLANGSEQSFGDFAELWWYPPERWRTGELVQLKLEGLPLEQVAGWYAVVPPSPAAPDRSLTANPAEQTAAQDPDLLQLRLGELTIQTRRSTWGLSVLDPRGRLLWQEAPLEPGAHRGPLGFQLQDGSWWHLVRVLDVTEAPGGFVLTAATDDPAGRTATVELTSLEPRSLRVQLKVSQPEGVTAVSQAVPSPADERLLGFGERFNAVNQRGHTVTTWAEDRRVAGYGESTYAPLVGATAWR